MCSNPNGHGHNYILEVTVGGEVDPETAFVLNLKELKDIVQTSLISKVDHKNLNLDVDFMKGIIPSTENIVIQIWNIIKPLIDNGQRKLHSIKLQETENNYVEYKG